jgi:hypothetical protein
MRVFVSAYERECVCEYVRESSRKERESESLSERESKRVRESSRVQEFKRV